MSRAYKIYNPKGLYFISFATVAWVDVFTRIEYKEVIIDSLKFCQKEKGLKVFAWCLMTNHIHLIAKAGDGFDLSGILRDFKKFTSRQILKMIENHSAESRREWMLAKFKHAGEYNSNNKEYQFWQQNNKPIELWSANVIEQKLNYIHMNPVEAGFVSRPEEYLYSSARNFNEERGLIALEPL
jgi:REP element-mobilizing transposase RayT